MLHTWANQILQINHQITRSIEDIRIKADSRKNANDQCNSTSTHVSPFKEFSIYSTLIKQLNKYVRILEKRATRISIILNETTLFQLEHVTKSDLQCMICCFQCLQSLINTSSLVTASNTEMTSPIATTMVSLFTKLKGISITFKFRL